MNRERNDTIEGGTCQGEREEGGRRSQTIAYYVYGVSIYVKEEESIKKMERIGGGGNTRVIYRPGTCSSCSSCCSFCWRRRRRSCGSSSWLYSLGRMMEVTRWGYMSTAEEKRGWPIKGWCPLIPILSKEVEEDDDWWSSLSWCCSFSSCRSFIVSVATE